jgi:hypothetical protein
MDQELSDVQSSDEVASVQVDTVTPETTAINATVVAYAAMLREIRSWGWWSLGLGALHLITSGFLSAPWGILLLIVGAASFLFREAAMFVVYGVTLAWAAISNILGGQATWIIAGLFQIYLAFRVFRQFSRFRRAQEDYDNLSNEEIAESRPSAKRTATIFPWAGGLLGILSLGGVITLLASTFVLVALSAQVPNLFGFLGGLTVNLGVLGFAVALSALLSGYRYKPVAAIGLAASVLTLAIEIALSLL